MRIRIHINDMKIQKKKKIKIHNNEIKVENTYKM